MKKLSGIIILFLSLCIVVPSKAQSAAGALIKTTTKEAREKIKEVTQAKKAASTATVKTGKTQQWGATGKQANGNTKTPVIIPVRPAPVDPVLLPRKHVFPVDTIGT